MLALNHRGASDRGIDKRLAATFEQSDGNELGNWWVSFKDVPKPLWLAVEILFRGAWVPVSPALLDVGDLENLFLESAEEAKRR
jgi:hypothetical protein